MSRTRRKATSTHRMDPIHQHEFSAMGRATRTKNKRKQASRLACRGNTAGKLKEGWVATND